MRWLLSCLLSAMAACAAPPILVNVDEANPPFMYGQHGKAMGIYPALINAAFADMKIPVLVEAKPWKRAFAEIDTGRAGVGGLYKNAERLEKYDYSDQLFVEKLVVYFNANKPIAFGGIEDLRGRRIGVIRGWSYGDDFDRLRRSGAFTAEEVASDQQNFAKLASERLDAVIAISEPGSTLAPRFANIRAATTPLALNPTFLAFSKSANRRALLQQFDQSLKKLQRSGEYQRIIEEEFAR